MVTLLPHIQQCMIIKSVSRWQRRSPGLSSWRGGESGAGWGDFLGPGLWKVKKEGCGRYLLIKLVVKGELWCKNGPMLSIVDNYCKSSRLLQVMDNYCPAAWYHIWLRSWQGNYNRGPFVPDGRPPPLSLSFSLIQQVFMIFLAP